MEKFNLRVYGLLINDLGQILVSDEFRNKHAFTKFPGGGMEFGEGFKETLKREFQEELNIDVEVGDLFYFNEKFQVSAFNSKHQLISFYYFVDYTDWKNIEVNQHELPLKIEGEKHRWIDLKSLEIGEFTFPIDKIVVDQLIKTTSQWASQNTSDLDSHTH